MFRSADINRRAAAIECYLDLDLADLSAKIVWTNYKKEHGVYQGALEYKESYTKHFLKQASDTIASGFYGVQKIAAVLDRIIAECTAIAVGQAGKGPIA